MTDREVKSQLDRFKEAAQKAQNNNDPEAFERLFGKLVPPIVPEKTSGKNTGKNE